MTVKGALFPKPWRTVTGAPRHTSLVWTTYQLITLSVPDRTVSYPSEHDDERKPDVSRHLPQLSLTFLISACTATTLAAGRVVACLLPLWARRRSCQKVIWETRLNGMREYTINIQSVLNQMLEQVAIYLFHTPW